jgi:hypothetical protein
MGMFREFTWCEKCQVVNLTAMWEAQGWRCPNPECDGDVLGAVRWCKIYGLQPAYPVVPEEGGYYPIKVK